MTKCPKCYVASHEPDEIAVHLMDHHGFAYDDAKLWLEVANESPALFRCDCPECQWAEKEMKCGNYRVTP